MEQLYTGLRRIGYGLLFIMLTPITIWLVWIALIIAILDIASQALTDSSITQRDPVITAFFIWKLQLIEYVLLGEEDLEPGLNFIGANR